MFLSAFRLGRLQRKVLLVVSTIVVVPMLVAGWFAAEWVSSSFEKRIEQWIRDAARSNQNWLQAYQNDAVMLGRVLADDKRFVAQLRGSVEGAIPAQVRRIAQELGVNLLQVYTPDRQLLYTSIPLEMQALWEPGQTEAVLKVVRKKKSMLAAVGITPAPRRGPARYYLVIGSLLGQDFTKELEELTGLKAKLYYREGKNYYDVFSESENARALTGLPEKAMQRLERDKKSYYAADAESDRYRGVYTPIVDSSGRVEGIMFSGLERRGVQDVLTNQVALFLLISLVGLIVGVATGLLLSRLVIRPLADLRNGVIALAGQNFDTTVPAKSDDEFGELAKAFNAMAARLREARDEQAQEFRRDKLAALGELSAALAHEIRNPIGVINTSSALLERADDDPKRRAELVRMVREESQRVAHLVQDFLDLSRHRKPRLEVIDPAQPLERALDLALAGRADVRVSKRFEHGNARVQADTALLQQAWSNIFNNALQAMDPGQSEIHVASRLKDGRVLLTVEDNGPGVSADILPRLFEPFFTTKERGTGLGLSIAYTLVEANGGRLEALPAERRGARFGMWFPVVEGVA
jgi:signal transduction histidine kinase